MDISDQQDMLTQTSHFDNMDTNASKMRVVMMTTETIVLVMIIAQGKRLALIIFKVAL